MFTVKSRVYGKAADGRTVLLYTPGMTITDDDARAAGLLAGAASAPKPARGLTIRQPGAVDDAPQARGAALAHEPRRAPRRLRGRGHRPGRRQPARRVHRRHRGARSAKAEAAPDDED